MQRTRVKRQNSRALPVECEWLQAGPNLIISLSKQNVLGRSTRKLWRDFFN